MRATPFAMLILFVCSLVSQPSDVLGQDLKKTHNGIVVSAAAGKLTMTDNKGKNEHSHKITLVAKVTLNGQPAQLPQLMKGDKVQVTVGPEGKVISVAAMR